MGTRKHRLTEAVLTSTHNICFEQKYENSQNIATENCHFCSREKSLYIARACFHNVVMSCMYSINQYQSQVCHTHFLLLIHQTIKHENVCMSCNCTLFG